MKSILWSIAFLFSLPTLGFAQKTYCGTEASEEYLQAVADGIYRNIPIADNATFEVPMQMKIIARDDGTDAKDADDVYQLLCELNTAYTSQNIQFWLYSYPEVINSTTLHVVTSRNTGASKLMKVYNEPYVVNVYFADLTLASDPGLTLCGYAYLPGNPSITGAPVGPLPGATKAHQNAGGVVLNSKGGNCTRPGSSTTFTHELGHYFSLLHPFQTTSQNPASVNAEYVTRGSGANCLTAGDRLCDTEADYCDLSTGQRWNNCAPAQTVRDFNGDVFKPDASLYMSYSGDNCQNKFTQDQATQIAGVMNVSPNNTSGRSYLKLYQKPNVGEVNQGATLRYPSAGQTNVVPNYIPLRWDKVANATDYHLQISTNASFSTVQFETIVQNEYFLYTDQVFAGLNPGFRLYWRVKPMNQGSFCQPFSGLRFFSLGSPYPAGFEDVSEADVKIYPSLVASDDMVNIYFEEGSQEITNIELIDMSGKSVRSRSLPAQLAGSSVQVEMQGLSAGMYTMKVQHGDKLSYKKIVVR